MVVAATGVAPAAGTAGSSVAVGAVATAEGPTAAMRAGVGGLAAGRAEKPATVEGLALEVVAKGGEVRSGTAAGGAPVQATVEAASREAWMGEAVWAAVAAAALVEDLQAVVAVV